MVAIKVPYGMHLPLGKDSTVDVLGLILATRMRHILPSTEPVYVVLGSVTARNEHGDCDVHWGGGRIHNIYFLDPDETTLVKDSVTEVKVGVVQVSREEERLHTNGATKETMPDHWKVWGIRFLEPHPEAGRWIRNNSGARRTSGTSSGRLTASAEPPAHSL